MRIRSNNVRAAFIFEELERANQIYGTSFHSPHEGYAVMLEEMDELFEEIKKKNPDKDKLMEEAVQIGAMAIKFIQSLEHWPWLDLKMSAHELKCLQCRYAVLTADKLAELESDPCLSCNKLCQWKP
ncbi:hypothetical protein Desaci_1285 [Desulfosporosinus acidiphilus SJ4]|uniref:MazG nucleotide pyrophosphohydrolase family protein n=1 Tax=Desulfosporosinus acidiphilus (strain DSM 22704 / JCM 16185 / SJ4) TaxID=646529 RepID=I4D3D7_DESAJ|nr:hypothetical protein [Desulfosporosinus acidiphilus]AFM40311.1 hypothetical protein Desaci_1285 [Desulfosporosinus acidiphilus SJ4]